MSVNIKGTLKSPLLEPIDLCKIRITSLNHIPYLMGETETNFAGEYDFTLAAGKHRIVLNQNDSFTMDTILEIPQDATGQLTLEDIFNNYTFKEQV